MVGYEENWCDRKGYDESYKQNTFVLVLVYVLNTVSKYLIIFFQHIHAPMALKASLPYVKNVWLRVDNDVRVHACMHTCMALSTITLSNAST